MSLAGLTASGGLISTTSVTYDGHGLETNDPVTVRAIGPGGALPSNLVAGTTYYAKRVSNEAFQLSATVDGAAIVFATSAIDLVVARVPDFDMWIEFYSRWVDTSLPAHFVPLGRTEAVHPLIRGLTADMVAERMFNISGQPSSEAMKALEVSTAAQLARFATGLPLRGAVAPSRANLAISRKSSTGTRPWGDALIGRAWWPPDGH